MVFLNLFQKQSQEYLLASPADTLQKLFLSNPEVLALEKCFYSSGSQSLILFQEFQKQFEVEKNSSLIENTFLPLRLGLHRKYRKQFILCVILNFLNQATGVNVLAVYSSDVFESLDFDSTGEIITVLLSKFANIRNVFAARIPCQSLGN